jgi:D-3-phosphoglycerate dehydrogenase
MKPTVLIPEPIASCGLDLLREECNCIAPWEDRFHLPNQSTGDDESQLNLNLSKADGVIVRLFRIDRQTLSKANRLKVISKHGVGVDNIDCETATARHIPVVYTPTANANAVAEQTLALMLALSRQLVPASIALREGGFNDRNLFQGVELAGKILVVVGLGRIGLRVARMASFGLGMNVFAYDPFLAKTNYSGPAILEDSLDVLFRKADFLTFHVPLTPETKHMINPQSLKLLKPECRIVNTSRGALIDETALALALHESRIAGVALDVFEEEPIPATHPLCHAPNALLTPHISSSTKESLERMSIQAAQGVLDVLHGKRPEYVANSEVFADEPK